MSILTILKNGNTFSAGSSESVDEMHGLSGNIFELWVAAHPLLGDEAKFYFDGLAYSCDEYAAEWNSDLDGYVITFSDGKTAQTQTYIESNRLDADFGDKYLERYTEYDDELSEEQDDLVDEFVSQVNSIQNQFGDLS
mgnify:CR=1 FL=1